MENAGVNPVRIPALLGPTATGKTAAAIRLAKVWDAEVVSADSVQVYRGLDIGSAKPTAEERSGIVHHMIDCIAPQDQDYSVAEYQRDAYAAFEDILTRGKRPFVVGGTGLYVLALESGLQFANTDSDPAFRTEWQKREEEEPGSAHRELAKRDPVAALKLHPNDTRRVIRALEIIEYSGLTLAEHAKRQAEAPKPYKLIKAALTMPRERLYERIEARVDSMMADGLVEEVSGLLARSVSPASTALQGLGYKEIVSYIYGKSTLEEATENIKKGTRHFAKRQWTWFRRDKEIRWFDVTEYADRETLIAALLSYYADGGIGGQ